MNQPAKLWLLTKLSLILLFFLKKHIYNKYFMYVFFIFSATTIRSGQELKTQSKGLPICLYSRAVLRNFAF